MSRVTPKGMKYDFIIVYYVDNHVVFVSFVWDKREILCWVTVYQFFIFLNIFVHHIIFMFLWGIHILFLVRIGCFGCFESWFPFSSIYVIWLYKCNYLSMFCNALLSALEMILIYLLIVQKHVCFTVWIIPHGGNISSIICCCLHICYFWQILYFLIFYEWVCCFLDLGWIFTILLFLFPTLKYLFSFISHFCCIFVKIYLSSNNKQWGNT